jgi:uncharacterized protein (DUF1499 family)
MKTILIIIASIVAALIAAFIIWFFILGVMSKSGKASGLINGTLSRCPDTPNCVCSEYKDDISHYIAPIMIPQNITVDALPVLEDIIRGMGGTILTENNNYIVATFTSRIFRFTDDFEIRIDPIQKAIHIRSASRVGRGDMGVNKKRVELFKRLFNEKISKANLPLIVMPKSSAQ